MSKIYTKVQPFPMWPNFLSICTLSSGNLMGTAGVCQGNGRYQVGLFFGCSSVVLRLPPHPSGEPTDEKPALPPHNQNVARKPRTETILQRYEVPRTFASDGRKKGSHHGGDRPGCVQGQIHKFGPTLFIDSLTETITRTR